MIRDGRQRVELRPRQAHELDGKFILPHLTENQLTKHPPTEEQLRTFRRASTFAGENLMPDLVTRWVGHVLISGPTKSGKTWLAKEMIKHNRIRKVYLVSDLTDNDPSLSEIRRSGKLVRLTEQPRPEEIANSYVLFDDITDRDWLKFRDKLYKQGRHQNIVCISVVHNILGGSVNALVLNESEWICLFPRSNKAKIIDLLERKYRMRHRFRMAIIDQAEMDGRYLFIHQHAPTFVMSSKFIVPF